MAPRLRVSLIFLGIFATIIALLRLTSPKHTAVPLGDRRVDSAATWHLKGWRLLEKKQVPWEIWGQARPPFLYERFGNSVRIAIQNREDVSLEAWGGKAPLTVLGSEVTAKNQLLLLQEWALPERDPKTKLPTSYRIQTGGAPLAELSATYNQPLPTEGLELAHQNTLIDTQQSLPTSAVPANTIYRSGTTVHAEVVASDPEGNLKVVVDIVPGPPGAPKNLPLEARCRIFSLLENSQERGGNRARAPRDDQGVVYGDVSHLNTDWDHPEYRTHPHLELYLARTTPLPPGATRPKTITLTGLTELTWAKEARQLFKLADVKRDRISVTIPLPAPVRTLPAPPIQEPLPMAIAMVRFRHYCDLRESTAKSDPQKQNLYTAKALQYFNQAMALCPPAKRKNYEFERRRLKVVGKPAE